jgi:NAD(P)-dependent dehydrogenase (short-subunit alcohol dehydrogenase family)
MARKLEGKVAIVTGAGRGIGRAIAISLANAGASVVVNDLGVELDGRRQVNSPADETVAEIISLGGHAISHGGSVADRQQVEEMVSLAVTKFGRIDILVHVAGILRDRMIFNMSEEDWDSVIEVHLKGAFNLFHAVSKRFREQKGGRIISMSSDSAYGAASQPNYAAAKAGILGLSWSTAEALKKYGVTTNAIMPSGATRMIDATPRGQATFEKTGKWPSELAIGTAADPANVAPLITYLASDAAAGINGQVFFSQGYTYARLIQPTIDRAIRCDGQWDIETLERLMPATLGEGIRPPFAVDMLTFLDAVPEQQWQSCEAGVAAWSNSEKST